MISMPVSPTKSTVSKKKFAPEVRDSFQTHIRKHFDKNNLPPKGLSSNIYDAMIRYKKQVFIFKGLEINEKKIPDAEIQ